MRQMRFGTGLPALAVMLLVVLAPGPRPASAEEVYDLLFRTGTLEDVPRDEVLDYEREVALRGRDELAASESGTLRLSFEGPDQAVLELHRGERHRRIGAFPAKVGNPLFLYFVETVIRDMATASGGSPFYIRNRVKAAVRDSGETGTETLDVGGREIAVTTVTLQPFADDPNRERMNGFADLRLAVRMSDAVPGWYVDMHAEMGSTGEAPAYVSRIRLPELEEKD